MEQNTYQKPYEVEEYISHDIFKSIESYMNFYDGIASNCFQFKHPGVKPLLNIDSYLYSSIKGTLDSINLVLSKGRINDAFALTRKYSDVIILDIYKTIVANDNLDQGHCIVTDINDWVEGKGKLPWHKTMIKKILSHKSLQEVKVFFDFDGQYPRIRNKLNNNNHYNSMYYVLLNDNTIYNENRIKELSQLSICIEELFILHFTYISITKPHYLSSLAFFESLELGEVPEECTLYRVASFAQKSFDAHIAKKRVKLAECIKKMSQRDF